MQEYDIVIGLEVHAELKTESKVFCSCKNKFGEEPNTNCCPVCLAMPGALPVLNKKAVELVIKAGLTIESKINNLAVFDRKNYFYPDLPKAYQISQLDRPVCIGGKLKLENKTININRIHLEEDAGKLIHVSENVGTLIDCNRGGVPLMELVTEPEISSADEAVEFLTKLREQLVFAGVADCKMEQGGMRCDVNVSVKPKGSEKLGNRTEMKNINSFKSVYRAIKYESQRQIDLIEKGGVVEVETRKWDDSNGISYAMRKKEKANDYRYFPDPDILAVEISEEDVERIRKTLPVLPEQLKEKYTEEYGLSKDDASIIVKDKKLIDFFENTIKVCNNPKAIANWLLVNILGKLKESNSVDLNITPEQLGKIINYIDAGKINSAIAKKIFNKVWDENSDVETLVKEMGGSVSESDLKVMIENIIKNNPKAVEDYKSSENPVKQIKWFVGQVMKETKGKCNPVLAENYIKELLN